jgi:hypothetical protein
MVSFKNQLNNVVKKSKFDEMLEQIMEQMMSSTVFGLGAQTNQGGAVPGGSDFYAPGDSRIPKALGSKKGKRARVQRRAPITTT